MDQTGYWLSRKAGGRGQEAGGKLHSVTARDFIEQGFNTPTEQEFSGSKSVGVESPTEKLQLSLLPPASCLLQ